MHNGMLVLLIMRASFRDTSHPVGPLFSTVNLRLCDAPGHIGVPDPHRHPTSSPRPTLLARRQTESGMHIVQLLHFILM